MPLAQETPVQLAGLRGVCHQSSHPHTALALTHGAGSDHQAPILRAVASALAASGWLVLRFDLAFRQHRSGPPRPADAAADQDCLRQAVAWLRQQCETVWMGGHSYGGRQASMLAAQDAGVAQGLLLQSYPLHPPGKPERSRTEHLARLHLPCFFVHGTRDTFGTPEELRGALRLIPARHQLCLVNGAGHDLKSGQDLTWLAEFQFFAQKR
jgi:predicted alpha/beta-hydrolase family hydrolase